ncbi:hypothetical protein DLJ57_05395 [Micromonospora chalcea]|nr:hypothetical protein DLJ57_05395 [Micromonospora chalcea]
MAGELARAAVVGTGLIGGSLLLRLRDAGLDTGTVAVDVPGGRLTVTVTADSCWLSGPAVLVATGTLTPSALTP